MAISQYALTTTFTPVASCSPGSFDQLLYLQQYIYLNYPNPVAEVTTQGCYPSEFLQSYAAQNTISTLLPPLAPLICPDGWTSAAIDYAPDVPTGYIACCPSGYELAGPSPPWPETRPAFNATCRSLATSLTITPYSTDSALPVAIWTGTAGDHAYALPLEGYATATSTETILGSSSSNSPSTASTTSSITPMPAPASTSNSSSFSSTQGSQTLAPVVTPTVQASASHSDTLSKGEIAGIVIGSVVGFFVIAAIVAYWIRSTRKRSPTDLQDQGNHDRHESVEEKPKASFFHRKRGSDGLGGLTELPNGQGSRVELPTTEDSRAELSAGQRANRAELPN